MGNYYSVSIPAQTGKSAMRLRVDIHNDKAELALEDGSNAIPMDMLGIHELCRTLQKIVSDESF